MEPIPSLLRRFALLASLDEDALEVLCAHLQTLRVPPARTVICSGETSTSLYFVVDGHLKVIGYGASGREIGLALLGPSDWFGELALVDREPRSATVVSVTESVLLALPAEAAREYLLREPSVVELLLRRLARMVRHDNERRALLSTGNSFQRVCGFLLSLAPGEEIGSPWSVERTLTHEAIASMTDTSRETVTRAIALLRQEGVAEKRGRTLVILNPQALRGFADSGRAGVG